MSHDIFDFSSIGAVVVNSTPKYFYLLDAFFGMYFRYRNNFQWPVYFATEVIHHPTVKRLEDKYPIHILAIPESESDFLESRRAALHALPPSIKYVLMLQEDFLLERPGIKEDDIHTMVNCMEHNANIHSMRIIPCPGPKGVIYGGLSWEALKPDVDDYYFTFQATIWRRDTLLTYFHAVIEKACTGYGVPQKRTREYNVYQVSGNPAENHVGKSILLTLFGNAAQHMAWVRRAAYPNGVYDCPFPYRPTAIVKGILQEWAKELIVREGFTLA